MQSTSLLCKRSECTERDPAAGQSSNFIDHLFTGNTLGSKSDIADGSLRGFEFRQFDNIVGDYYVAPAFLEAIAVSAPPPLPAGF